MIPEKLTQSFEWPSARTDIVGSKVNPGHVTFNALM